MQKVVISGKAGKIGTLTLDGPHIIYKGQSGTFTPDDPALVSSDWSFKDTLILAKAIKRNGGRRVPKDEEYRLARKFGRTPDAVNLKSSNIIEWIPGSKLKGLPHGSKETEKLAVRAIYGYCRGDIGGGK
jgi:hypothetical protein